MKNLLIVAATLAVLVALAGCQGGAGTSVEPKQGHSETQKETTPTPNESAQAIIGQEVSGDGLDFRVLDTFETDEFYYSETHSGEKVDAYPMMGKFFVVIYSVRNNSQKHKSPTIAGTLKTDSGETFPQADGVEYPRHGAFGSMDLNPRQVDTGMLIFDVPTDVSAESVNVDHTSTVDVTRADLSAIPPEEREATYWEYMNMQDYHNAYNLFGEAARAKFTEEQFAGYMHSSGEADITMDEYSFTSVQRSGNTATVQSVASEYFPEDFETKQYRIEIRLTFENGAFYKDTYTSQVAAFTGQ